MNTQRVRIVLAFVDGHVGLTEIYWNGVTTERGSACYYDPPAGFDYQWSNK